MPGLSRSFSGTFSLPLPLAEGGMGRPSGGRPSGEGKRQLDRSRRLLVAFCSCIEVGGRGVRPAAQPPSFGRCPGAPPPDGRPKEPGARKGGPTVRDPAFRYGQPPVLVQGAGHPGAVRQNLYGRLPCGKQIFEVLTRRFIAVLYPAFALWIGCPIYCWP